jgi:cytoskeletal protein RodZ
LLHSNLKYRVAVSQAERNATAQTTVTHVGKPLAIPPSIAKRPAAPIQQSSPQAAVANGAPTSGAPIEKAAAEPAQKPVLRLVSRLFGGNGPNKR